ncbi:MAG: hypothetical protein FWC77_06745 [Defluviitaleaceae bacterium]|nr:hypothetical protein [Defluviitaleaceae bacterium]
MKIWVLVLSIFTMVLILTGCARNSTNEEAQEAYAIVPIAESNTFLRHLEGILQLPEATAELSPHTTEHNQQLTRLREFAKTLNDGGVELSDIRICGIIYHPGGGEMWCHDTNQLRPDVHFSVLFMHEADFNNAELIEEMLAFTGIPEENILISLSHTGWVGMFWGHSYRAEHMLGNQAVYDFMRPYLRLMEFAMEANRGTVNRDEIIITMVNDSHQQQPIGMIDASDPLWSGFFPRFNIGLSRHGYAMEGIKDEILEYAGLTANEVKFEMVDAHSWYMEHDFLRVNEEHDRFYHQFERLGQLWNLLPVRSARRDIVMDRVIISMSPAGSRGEGSGFYVGLQEHHADSHQALKETILSYTGIDEDNLNLELSYALGMGWLPLRRNLTPLRQADYDALQTFKSAVNAPFWDDKYLHDPVIVQIRLDGRWNFDSAEFALSNFIIMLYDPDLENLTAQEVARRTLGFKNEITAATGVSNIRLRVYRPGETGSWRGPWWRSESLIRWR